MSSYRQMHLIPPTLYAKLMNTEYGSTEGKCLNISQLNSIQNEDGGKVFISQKPEVTAHNHLPVMSNSIKNSTQQQSNEQSKHEQTMQTMNTSHKSHNDSSFQLDNSVQPGHAMDASAANNGGMEEEVAAANNSVVKEHPSFVIPKSNQPPVNEFFSSELPDDEKFTQVIPPPRTATIASNPIDVDRNSGESPNLLDNPLEMPQNDSFGELNDNTVANNTLANRIFSDNIEEAAAAPLPDDDVSFDDDEINFIPDRASTPINSEPGTFMLSKPKPPRKKPVVLEPKHVKKLGSKHLQNQKPGSKIKKEEKVFKQREVIAPRTKEEVINSFVPVTKGKVPKEKVMSPEKNLKTARALLRNKHQAAITTLSTKPKPGRRPKIQPSEPVAVPITEQPIVKKTTKPLIRVNEKGVKRHALPEKVPTVQPKQMKEPIRRPRAIISRKVKGYGNAMYFKF